MDEMKLLTAQTPIEGFMKSLQVGELFGFSARYTKEQVIYLAEDYGVAVSPPNARTPERKKYGDYVLKVRRVGRPTETAVHFSEHWYKLERAKADRKCKNPNDVHVIRGGERCVVEFTPKNISSKVVYDRSCFCIPCAKKRLVFLMRRIKEFHDSI